MQSTCFVLPVLFFTRASERDCWVQIWHMSLSTQEGSSAECFLNSFPTAVVKYNGQKQPKEESVYLSS